MEITEVRVKLTSSQSDRVRAFCSVTLDREFVVRDIKVIEGTNGLFVAMPSRKIADHCPKCRGKNHLRAKFCNECGAKLRDNRAPRNGSGRSKLHADVAHPINMACRERLQDAILGAFNEELESSKQPGYKPIDLDEGYDDDSQTSSEKPKVEKPVAEKVEPEAPVSGSDDEFDNGAEYAALIAELRSGKKGRGADRREQRDDHEAAAPEEPVTEAPEPEVAEPEESESEVAEPEESESVGEKAEVGGSEQQADREFGKGIL